MRILVVYCHPDEERFQWTIQSELTTRLRADGHDLQVLDLYAEGFDPVLDREAWRAHRQDRGFDAADLAPHVAALLAAEGVVFICPTGRFGLPALLKGWLDRVWVEGVAFEKVPGSNRPRARLQHIRSITVVTTYGSSRRVNMLEGEAGRRLVRRWLRVLCHPLARSRWIALYDMDRTTDAARTAFLDRVEKALS